MTIDTKANFICVAMLMLCLPMVLGHARWQKLHRPGPCSLGSGAQNADDFKMCSVAIVGCLLQRWEGTLLTLLLPSGHTPCRGKLYLAFEMVSRSVSD